MQRSFRRITSASAKRSFCAWPKNATNDSKPNAPLQKSEGSPMKKDNVVIEVDSLVRSFGQTDAVDGLSFTVPRGKCYGFFGRNGAGKTTTIKCLLNLLRPSEGSVRLFGLDPERNEVAVKS